MDTLRHLVPDMTVVGVDFAVAHAITAAKETNTFGRSYRIAISAAKDFILMPFFCGVGIRTGRGTQPVSRLISADKLAKKSKAVFLLQRH
jgi:hypothetical protein